MSNENVIDFHPRAVLPAGDVVSLCRQYLEHLQRRGYAAATITSYRCDLEQLCGFLLARDKGLIQSVNVADLDGFIDALLEGEGVSPRTAARKRESVRGMFRFAEDRLMLTDRNNPARRMSPVRFNEHPVIAPETDRLLALIDSIPRESPSGRRDRAMMRVMLSGALRVGAMVLLDVFRPDDPPRWCIWPSGIVFYRAKGGNTRESMVDAETMTLLNDWIEVRHLMFPSRRAAGRRVPEPEALFLNVQGTRMTRVGVAQIVRAHGRRFGLEGMHCHLFRHRRLGDVMERVGVHEAHYLSGHRHVSTTVNTYGRHANARLRQRIRDEAPLDGKERDACS